MASDERRDRGRDQNRQATFDALFVDQGDPWSLETSDYERDKRTATLAALGDRRFASALEIGCAYGVLTEQLAPLCDALLAIDISAVALDRARARLASCRYVQFRQGEIPRDWPGGDEEAGYDLIVLSEVLYFLSPEEVARTSLAARGALKKGGVCLLVNWTGATDLPLDGNEVVRLFEASAQWHCTFANKAKNYRLDRYAPRRDLK